MIVHMRKIYILIILACAAFSSVQSQLLEATDKVWIFFNDKDTAGFNPNTFFDALAIERRMLNDLHLYDFTDVPVTPSYVKAVESITENNRAVSRWFNAMCCNATEAQ
ncbi:MAG: serine protease AprX, partial [Bacteroidia bacterium]